MMDKSEVKTWVDANAYRLLKEYGVPHWKVAVEYCLNDSVEWGGKCETQPRYEIATITLNCANIYNKTGIEEILRHEICHILHAPFNWYALAVKEALEKMQGMEPLLASLDTVFDTAAELTVKNLERMHAGHKEAYKRKR